MDKKGLVIVYDAHTVQQFAWYYYTYGKNKKWEALCLPDGYRGVYTDVPCENMGIFENVIKNETEFLSLKLTKKFALICEMIVFFLIGKRKQCAKNILNRYVNNIDDYDEIIAICETGFISGLCALLANEKTVSYLDDGLGDYDPRDRWMNGFKKSSFTYWQSFVMNRMGYGCKGRFYFKPTKNCYKYCAVPNEMKYRNYKELRNFDMSKTDIAAYDSALERAYPGLNEVDFDAVDAVFFSDNLEVFSTNYQEYYNKCTEAIGKENKTVLLKRHPRDGAKYVFPDDVKVIEVDNAIPAELMLPYLKGKKLYFSIFSSIIIFMQQYSYEANVFYSDKLYEENLSDKNAPWRFISKKETVDLCDRFSADHFKLIEV